MENISRGVRRHAPATSPTNGVIVVLDRAAKQLDRLTDQIDRQVESFTWSPDSKNLFFTTIDRGLQAIQFIPAHRRRRACRCFRPRHFR